MKKKGRKGPPASTADVTESHRHLWPLLFLFGVTLLAYAGSLNGTWALDDSAIGQFSSVQNVITLRLGYRRIAYLTFLLNRLVDPVSPLNYRITNIFIHACNAVLVYALAFLTLGLPGWKDRFGPYRQAVAFISGVIFALHPLNINAVAYIVQRMTSLATMFTLLALLSYVGGATAKKKFGAVLLYALSGSFVLLGIFSKENAVMAVPLIMLYDFFFLTREARPFARRAVIVAAGAVAIAAGTLFFLPFHKTFLSIVGTLSAYNQTITPQGWTAMDVSWTPVQHVLTEMRVVGRYLLLLIFPLPGLLVFDWWGFPVSTGIGAPATTLLSLCAILVLVIFALVTTKRFPFLSFGILWYFTAISLESFITVGADLYFEHRNYLPLAGLVFGIVAQGSTAVTASALTPRRLWTTAVLVAALLGGLTFQRNLVWRDSVALWTDTVHKAPGNMRALIALGNASMKASDIPTAKRCYADALQGGETMKSPQVFQDAAYSLGMLSLYTGDISSAEKVITILDKKIEGSLRLSILKGFYRTSTGDIDGAIAEYKTVLPSADGIDLVVIHTLLGDAYRKKERPDKAIKEYGKAAALDPSFAPAFYGIGDTYLGARDVDRATSYIGKALAIDPLSALALSDMAEILLLRKEPPEKAREFAARAVANSPAPYQPYLTMGNVLTVMKEDEAAEEYFRKAREHGAQEYLIPLSKARAYYMRGDKEKMKPYLEQVLTSKDAPDRLKEALSGNLPKR